MVGTKILKDEWKKEAVVLAVEELLGERWLSFEVRNGFRRVTQSMIDLENVRVSFVLIGCNFCGIDYEHQQLLRTIRTGLPKNPQKILISYLYL